MAANRPQETAGAARIRWDYAEMKTAYANVANATGTREEVMLYFGISQPIPGEGADAAGEMSVRVSDRIVLSPFAAKRLAQLLTGVVQAYEARFGTLPTGADGPSQGA